MNKSELVEAVATKAGLNKSQAEDAVNAFTSSVMEAVTSGDKVSILGFGTFNPKSRAARTGRNPQTGAPVKIAASKSVGFTVGSAFKESLNKRGAKKAGAAKKAAKKVAKSSKKK